MPDHIITIEATIELAYKGDHWVIGDIPLGREVGHDGDATNWQCDHDTVNALGDVSECFSERRKADELPLPDPAELARMLAKAVGGVFVSLADLAALESAYAAQMYRNIAEARAAADGDSNDDEIDCLQAVLDDGDQLLAKLGRLGLLDQR